MLRPKRIPQFLGSALLISLSGCYGGPCADPTAMILFNFVIPALLIGVVIYVVAKD